MAYIIMALGQGMGSWVPMMTMLNHWFSRRRAVAIGWANVGSRFGALLIVPAIAWAVDPDQDRLGWSLTATCLGIFVVAIAFPISRIIRNRPQEYGLLPDGDRPASPSATTPAQGSATRSQSPAEADLTASQALRTSAFWLISFGHGFTSMVILAIMSHLGLLIEDKGYTVQMTGWIIAVYTVVAMGFQLGGGYVGDRVPKRIALFIFTSIQAGAVVVLTTATSLSTFFLFAVLFGIGFGGRNPADGGGAGRVLRQDLFWQDTRAINGPNELAAADIVADGRLHERPAGHLQRSVPDSGWAQTSSEEFSSS